MRARQITRVVAACAIATVVGAISIFPANAAVRRQGGGGGDIVIGAEQEGDCADWISSCAGSSWQIWIMGQHTMPRTFDFVPKSKTSIVYERNVLLASEPTVEEEGGKTVITYEINPDAVWSDGEPITSHDFFYTWDQIVNGEDIYDPTGYIDIESVDDSDPAVAVVTFSTPYSGWRSLFGGQYGIYPSHILEGQDRNAATVNGYDWSGGPYIADWQKGVSVTLTPNPNWYGDPVKNDSVTFQFLTDTAAEFQAFTSGQVDAIYPQPQPDVIEQIEAGIEGANSYFTPYTPNAEALWINNAAFPFDSVKVRQAFAYSIDRDVVVERLFGGLGITEALNTINPPITAEFADTEAFSKYTLNLKKVKQLMTSDGWEKNADGFWEKDGEQADIVIQSTEGNARRALTEEILQELLGNAGFNLTIENHSAGDLFGQNLPNGDFQVGLYAQVATQLEPGNCSIFCSYNIPTEDNEFSGQNWTRTDLPQIDPLLETVGSSSDSDEVAAANKKADKISAKFLISLPLDPLPNISLWSKDIKGINKKAPDSGVFALFWNLAEWTKS
ncbi:MAG: peptide ABC transporter substrate-binding protein [Actinobacteria bacterium]|nr:peptide ABC transporter substrate-binding protein [Actinomycetota bacterium]